MGKDIFRFFLKAFGFSIAFWLTSIVFISFFTGWMQPASSGQSAEQNERLAQTYEAQLKKSGEQLDAAMAQRRRLDALLSRWEEQADRHDLVLRKWEQAVGGTAHAAAASSRSGH